MWDIKRFVGLFFIIIFFNVTLYADTGITVSDLFTDGGISSSSSSVKIGDLLLAMVIGILTYILIVGSFFSGFLNSYKVYTKNEGGGSSALDISNLASLFFKPFFYLIVGVIIFNFFNLLLDWYNIDIYDELSFFYEVRYSDVLPKLDVSNRLLPFAKSFLVSLDLFSRFAFWSLVFVYIAIFIMAFVIIFSVMFFYVSDNGDIIIVKKILISLFVFIITLILTNIFNSYSEFILFKNSPNIADVGVITNIDVAVKAGFKHLAKLGLNGFD